MATRKMPSLMKLASEVKTENAEVSNWQAREDLACLTRAKEVEADKKRMMAVKKIAASQIKTLEKIKGR
jgi:hypothetical protein